MEGSTVTNFVAIGKMNEDTIMELDSPKTSTKENAQTPNQPLQAPRGRGYRHKMAYMLFTAYAVSYCLRFNLSMAMVGMVNDDVHAQPDTSCTNLAKNVTDKEKREFDWDADTRARITGSFFVGYMLTQVPGGMLAQKYGGKWVVGGGIFGASVLSFLIPPAARKGPWWLIIVRVLQGIAEGVVLPAGHMLSAQWTPPVERSQLVAIALSGNQGGSCLAMLISGLMIYSNELEGWSGVFYVCGGIGLLWCVFWILFAYNKPWEHPNLSGRELQYIRAAIGDQVSRDYVPPPFLKFLRSGPVWAITVAQTVNSWGSIILLTGLPTYMGEVLHYDLNQNSWMSGLPFLGMMFVAIGSGYMATACISAGAASTVTVRRIFNTIGLWLPALAFVALTFSNCNRGFAVSLIFIAISLNGAVRAGYDVSHIDIAPQHAGVLIGLCNLAGNIVSIFSPYLLREIRAETESLRNWNSAFFIVAGIFFGGNLFYIIFVSATEQSFNRPVNKNVQ